MMGVRSGRCTAHVQDDVYREGGAAGGVQSGDGGVRA